MELPGFGRDVGGSGVFRGSWKELGEGRWEESGSGR